MPPFTQHAFIQGLLPPGAGPSRGFVSEQSQLPCPVLGASWQGQSKDTGHSLVFTGNSVWEERERE